MQTSRGATPFLSSCRVTSRLRPGTVVFELWYLQVEHNSGSAPEQLAEAYDCLLPVASSVTAEKNALVIKYV